MMTASCSRTPTTLRPGDHFCALYESEEEHQTLLTAYLREGLRRHEKVVYIVDAHTPAGIVDYLLHEGIPVAESLASEQLSIHGPESTYLKPGHFSPEAMIELLTKETARALAEGYTALRVTGEMSWALKGQRGSERLTEYESKVNEVFSKSQCIGLCQYDRRLFPHRTLMEVLMTHPGVILGTEVYDNPYYLPPAAFLSQDVAGATVNRWLEHLKEWKQTQRALQETQNEVDALTKKLDQFSV